MDGSKWVAVPFILLQMQSDGGVAISFLPGTIEGPPIVEYGVPYLIFNYVFIS
jgi:hypothetical protein